MPHSGMTDPQATPPAGQLGILMAAHVYWTARAMQEQGSRFFRAIGAALEASDAHNRRLIYQTWPAECWDFYQRGRLLEAAEPG